MILMALYLVPQLWICLISLLCEESNDNINNFTNCHLFQHKILNMCCKQNIVVDVNKRTFSVCLSYGWGHSDKLEIEG